MTREQSRGETRQEIERKTRRRTKVYSTKEMDGNMLDNQYDMICGNKLSLGTKKTNRSLQATEGDESCVGITGGIQLTSLCSFQVLPVTSKRVVSTISLLPM